MSVPKSKHVTEQLWVPEQREDGLYLVGADDRSVVLKMQCSDRESDLLVAGYIAGLQVQKVRALSDQKPGHSQDVTAALLVCARLDLQSLLAAIEVHRGSCRQADCPVLVAMEAEAATRRANFGDRPS